jgi:hypothetical protein
MKKILSSSIVKNPTDLQKGAATHHVEDRSAYLRSNSVVTWSGTQLSFTTDIVLEIINTLSGTTSTHTILTANSPISLNNNESLWVSIDRTQTSENLTPKLSDTDPIPAQSDANGSVFILAKRIDVSGIGYLHLPFSKQVLNQGQAVRLGASGSSSGTSDGINLVPLDSNFQPNKTTNSDAEISVGDWAAYADAAATFPVDMTGGSPNTTIVRSTSSPLNGAAHFLMTINSGASRQGEGVSCVINIPRAYRGRMLAFTFPFQATGTLVEDDFRLFAYDITNSVVITPFSANKILGAEGMALALFPVATNTASVRVGIHIARTSTAAATILFDDVVVSPHIPVVGVAGSDLIAYTPTFANLGTTSNVAFWWRRDGDMMEIFGYLTVGTTAATQASFTLPTGFSLESAKISPTNAVNNAGPVWGDWYLNGNNDHNGAIVSATGTSTSVLYFGFVPSAAGLNPQNGTVIATSGNSIGLKAKVPISGWSSNVTMSQSSTFFISNAIASGTRVTTAPTILGEYRTTIKNNAATTTADNAPAASPSTSDGMRIYSTSGSGAGTSGQTNRWDIFVGKNKNVFFQFYSGTDKTGEIDTDYFSDSASGDEAGLYSIYDPVTGIASVYLPILSSAANRSVGRSYSGIVASGGSASDCYFDIKVSENALAVQQQQIFGSIIGSSYSQVQGPVALTTGIPTDNTIPQSGEGNEILTASYTPKMIGSKLIITASATGSEDTNVTNNFVMALFKDSDADALAADAYPRTGNGSGLDGGRVHVSYEHTVSSFSTITFKIRVGGGGSGAKAATLNVIYDNSATSFNLGSTITSWLRVEEIAQV